MNSSIRLLRILIASALVAGLPLTSFGFPTEHGVLASCAMTGPSLPYAVHAGEQVRLTVMLQSICAHPEDVVTVTNIRVIVHHASGDVTMTNLISKPLVLPGFVSMEVITNVVVEAGDGDMLRVEWIVDWADVPQAGGPATRGSIRGGSHIQILPKPSIAIRPAGAGAIKVCWPASATSRLESCPGVNQPWTAVAGLPAFQYNSTLGYTEWVMTFSTSAPAQFFRLAPEVKGPGTGNDAGSR